MLESIRNFFAKFRKKLKVAQDEIEQKELAEHKAIAPCDEAYSTGATTPSPVKLPPVKKPARKRVSKKKS